MNTKNMEIWRWNIDSSHAILLSRFYLNEAILQYCYSASQPEKQDRKIRKCKKLYISAFAIQCDTDALKQEEGRFGIRGKNEVVNYSKSSLSTTRYS